MKKSYEDLRQELKDAKLENKFLQKALKTKAKTLELYVRLFREVLNREIKPK